MKMYSGASVEAHTLSVFLNFRLSLLTTTEMAQKGRYVEAFAMMEQVDAHSLRTLKAHQYWATILGVLKLIRQLHRSVCRPSLPINNADPCETM